MRFKLIISSTSSAKLDETGQIHLFIESRSRKSVLYAGDNTKIWKNHPLRFKLIISSASSAKLDKTGQIHLLLEVAVENLYYMQEVIPEFGSKRRLQVTKFIFSTTMNMRQRKETRSSSESSSSPSHPRLKIYVCPRTMHFGQYLTRSELMRLDKWHL